MDIKLINDDCLKALKEIEDNSVNLVLIDPPYNIGKDTWDKWKTVELYVEFMKDVFLELERVLADNGSFYFFHNDFMQIVELQNMINKETKFKFKQFIVWNKRFNECKNKGFLDGFLAPKGLRNYQQMAEYALFYTFQDETGRKKIDHDVNNYKTLRDYSRQVHEYINIGKKKINEIMGNQKMVHFFQYSQNNKQFSLPKKETYDIFTEKFNLTEWEGFREYESLREEYESLREEYESLRYTFNNQHNHHSVWNYNISGKEESGKHLTPKPIDLLENILIHSSNEGDVVLDCFMGSGSTGVACKNLNRNFIGIEIDKDYFDIAEKRINSVNEK